MFSFGEFDSYLSGDAYNFMSTRGNMGISGTSSFTNGYLGNQTVGLYFPTMPHPQSGTYELATIIRASSQIGAHVQASPVIPVLAAVAMGSGGAHMVCDQTLVVPGSADNAIPMTPIFLTESTTGRHLRGRVRGMYFPLGLLPTGGFVNGIQILDDVVIGGTVRKVAVCRAGIANRNQVAFDLGEW
jgi:hypothetical protein